MKKIPSVCAALLGLFLVVLLGGGPSALAAQATAAPSKAALGAPSRPKVPSLVARPRALRQSPEKIGCQAGGQAPAPSFGQLAGLHASRDPLDLKSSVALVIDQDTREVLFSKNEMAVLPIASLTKLMTGLVVSEAHLDMDEKITIAQADVDTEKGSRSRLWLVRN